MRTKGFLFAVSALFSVALIIACNKNHGKNGNKDFDQKALLANIADNLIVPAYQKLATESDNLTAAAQAFTEAPGADKLLALQAQFAATYKAWIFCEPYNFGPAEETIMLNNAINYWPARANLVDAELAGSAAINDAYVAGLGAEKKGFPALGYLLFDEPGGNENILQSFSDARRKEYTVALCVNIANSVKLVASAWNGYKESFKSNTGTGLNTSISLLMNGLLFTLENSKNKRLGIPIGRKNKFSTGPVDPGALELPYSYLAKDMLVENIKALTNLYNGNSGSADGVGFDDYLDFMKVQEGGVFLEATISASFERLNSKIGAIVSPMQTSVTGDPSLINAAWQEAGDLVTLLKIDMASNLGILITFSDNDGD